MYAPGTCQSAPRAVTQEEKWVLAVAQGVQRESAPAADVVGLYTNPPAKAIVLCVDERPSIQALERGQAYLKLSNGRAVSGQSHDYKRHGIAALNVATGKVFASHCKRRRRIELLGFMNRVVAPFQIASCMSSSTISTPTRSAGSGGIRMFISISPRRVRHASIRSRPGSRSCRVSR